MSILKECDVDSPLGGLFDGALDEHGLDRDPGRYSALSEERLMKRMDFGSPAIGI